MRVLDDLTVTSPSFGLAVEEALLSSARRQGTETIRLWINDRAVVIGRSQAIASEVDEPRAERLRIPILRRLSGGGTVYHYPGNLNVSLFVRKRPDLSHVSTVFLRFGEALAAAVCASGVDCRPRDNGLYIDGRKVGGAAQAHQGDVLLYHSTLLVEPPDLEMSTLLRALRSDYRPGGVASRPAVTICLAEATGRPIDIGRLAGDVCAAVANELALPAHPGALSVEEARLARTLEIEKYGRDTWTRLR